VRTWCAHFRRAAHAELARVRTWAPPAHRRRHVGGRRQVAAVGARWAAVAASLACGIHRLAAPEGTVGTHPYPLRLAPDVSSPRRRLLARVRSRTRCSAREILPSRFKPANLSLRSSVGRSTQGPMDRPSFLLFVRAVLPESPPPEARLGGLPRLVVRCSQKPLAVPAFTVQNGRAWS